MPPFPFTRRPSELLDLSRRDFLTSAASGLGAIALRSLLLRDGVVERAPQDSADPLAPRAPHFPAKAKRCIFVFLAGGPSQFDLYDPKPALNRYDGHPLPESLVEGVRFAFIQKDSAVVVGTPTTFSRHGECGMELSQHLTHVGKHADKLLLVRSMHTDQFNHHPAQLLMQCGRAVFGLPTMGSWVLYGLGSESRDLPGYVVLTSGRGSSGGSTLWQSGFLPSSYAGVPFRSDGDAVLALRNPPGISDEMQGRAIRAISALNREQSERVRDPEVESRIANYELAHRMQASAPDLIDLSQESEATLAEYGVDREDPVIKAARPGGPGQYRSFATNCLLARRLIERDVRFVNIIHASWDHHANLDVELPFNAAMADQPLGALIGDLDRRGLLDETLVVVAGEFGRTPLGENRRGDVPNTGRDHHPFAFSVLLAGGGLRGGLTYGATDDFGWGVVEDPVHVNDFHATLLNQLGLDHLRLTHRYQGRDFRLTDVAGRVVHDWIA
ncbi:MAG: DUF1501 domain-containing protein [Planctomycetota bacterium]